MKFAVAYINFCDNELIIEIIYADSWSEALINHTSLNVKETATEKEKSDNEKYLIELCKNGIEEAKNIAFDGDWMFDVKLID